MADSLHQAKTQSAFRADFCAGSPRHRNFRQPICPWQRVLKDSKDVRRNNGQMIGSSEALRELQEEVAQVAQSDAKVLITGESGVGKELVAHAIHAGSSRADRPFVVVNCAGVPETLLESEMFGHVKGSFTGAYRDRPGKLEQADTGTVFLDEIGEMTLRMQGMLLRFLETGELQRVGADQTGGRINVRVVAATNRGLRDMIAQGQFREDLFYRLNVIHLVVPPLRERKEDITALVQHFIKRVPAQGRYTAKEITPEAMALLVSYGWPGNIRELENVIERCMVTGNKPVIDVPDLPQEVRSGRNGHDMGRKHERRHTIVDELFQRIVEQRESFWTVVYPLYMQREITRNCVRELVKKGLVEARGNYKIVARIFNMEPTDYKRFLNFLRKHECQVPFRGYRE